MNRLMKMIIILLVLMNVSRTVQSGQQIKEENYQSHQNLIIHQYFYQLKFRYCTKYSHIPSSLTQLLRSNGINILRLQMGSTNPSYLNRQKSQIQLQKYPPISQGISLLIQKNTQFTSTNLQIVANVFSISGQSEFMIYFDQLNMIYSSNPNDKFCAQHLNNIVRLFLPCGMVSGVGALIIQKQFFVEKRFYGVRLEWDITRQEVSLRFFVDKSSKQIRNFVRMSQQKRQSKRCLLFDDFQVIKLKNIEKESKLINHNSQINKTQQMIFKQKMYDSQDQEQTQQTDYYKSSKPYDDISKNKNSQQHNNTNDSSTKSPITIFIQPISDSTFITSAIKSNYYNSYKMIQTTVNLEQLKKFQIIDFSVDGIHRQYQIQYRLLLPKAFAIEKIEQRGGYMQNRERKIQGQYYKSEVFVMREDVQNFQNGYQYQSSNNIFNGRQFLSLLQNKNTLILIKIKLFSKQYLQNCLNRNDNNNRSFIKFDKKSQKIQQTQQQSLDQCCIIFNIHYRSNLKPFQSYENIAGGGEEFMNIPVVIKQNTKTQEKTNQSLSRQRYVLIHSNSNSNLFDRLLEPDFSIPFHTLTFIVGIIGYLWIGVWRAFFKQVSYVLNSKTKQQQHAQIQGKKDK